jgi:hypothetical protein
MPASVLEGTYKERKYMGEVSKCNPFSPTSYLVLNSLNLGRGMEGTRKFCFSPLDFVSKKTSGTSLF